VDGFWSELEILPWSVEIPHEEVNFESGSDAIPDAEVHKVDDAYAQLLEAVARYGDLVEISLYVAGYTDTVGGPGDNQALSERRARSIASAFRARGFGSPIYYQGFGEDALAVATPDNTDELRNRRALYLLAAQPPLPSSQVPRASWRRLD
jgi:outer membrane protein OmpA-like peptidoglycan-associated protein